MNITAVTVLVEIEGQVCLAPIATECGLVFVGMLPAYQAGNQKAAQLVKLPPDIAQHVYAIWQELAARKKPAHQGEGRE